MSQRAPMSFLFLEIMFSAWRGVRTSRWGVLVPCVHMLVVLTVIYFTTQAIVMHGIVGASRWRGLLEQLIDSAVTAPFLVGMIKVGFACWRQQDCHWRLGLSGFRQWVPATLSVYASKLISNALFLYDPSLLVQTEHASPLLIAAVGLNLIAQILFLLNLNFVAEGHGGLKSLWLSAELMGRHFVTGVILYCVMTLAIAVCVISVGVGLIWLMPWIVMMTVVLYEKKPSS